MEDNPGRSASDLSVRRWSWTGSRPGQPERAGERPAPGGESRPHQGLLWTAAPYQDEAPAITSPAELAGAIEHLHYAVFRRYKNQLTRAERSRLDNTIDNALFKIDRYLLRLDPAGDGTSRSRSPRAARVDPRRPRTDRAAVPPGAPRRSEAGPARHR